MGAGDDGCGRLGVGVGSGAGVDGGSVGTGGTGGTAGGLETVSAGGRAGGSRRAGVRVLRRVVGVIRSPAAVGGPSAGSAVGGSGSTTGPSDGGGMNGLISPGWPASPTVAEPAPITAMIGIDAVPASSATVNR